MIDSVAVVAFVLGVVVGFIAGFIAVVKSDGGSEVEYDDSKF